MSKNYLLNFGKTSVVVACQSDDEALKLAEQFGKETKVEEYQAQDVTPVAGKDLRAVAPVKPEVPANN